MPEHYSTGDLKDFLIQAHMTMKSQNKVGTLTSGHPVVLIETIIIGMNSQISGIWNFDFWFPSGR